MTVYLGSQNVGVGMVEMIPADVKNEDIIITENGVYNASEGYTGLGTVTVEIDTVNNQDKTITENGTYIPDEGYTGFGSVTVDVESSGGGEIIEVLNKTGAVINQGDKVWLSENTQVGGVSSVLDSLSAANPTSVTYVDRTGNFVAYGKGMYDITNDTRTYLGETPNQYCRGIYYGDDDSVIYDNNDIVYRVDSKKQLKTSGAYFLGRDFVASSGKYSADTGGYYYRVLKMDMTTGLTIRDWKINVQPTKQSFVINDVYYKIDGTKLYYWDISEDIDEETIQAYKTGSLLNMNKTGSFYPLGVTSDKKYIFTYTYQYPQNMSQLIMYEVVSKTQLRQLSMSEMPEDLQEFYGINGCYTFNPYTGVLTAVASEGTLYAAVKYENGEWTKIPISLPTLGSNFYGPMTVSDDLSRACVVIKSGSSNIVPVVINLTSTEGYSAIPYKPYTVNEKTITATALAESQPNELTPVQIGSVTNEDIIITENGIYEVGESYSGFGTVTVNVESSGGGDVIQAINNTGLMVNVDDRVWIKKDIDFGYAATLNVSDDALTGFAKTSVENGGFFDVNIILPKELTAFITVDTDNAYIGVE